jgi:hypothetical protein
MFMEVNYFMFAGTCGRKIAVGEKSIIFMSVTFQNLDQNTCNVRLATHLQVDLPSKIKSDRQIIV